jgi:hypothetical protein
MCDFDEMSSYTFPAVCGEKIVLYLCEILWSMRRSKSVIIYCKDYAFNALGNKIQRRNQRD